ncbi:SMI1/KNR4 family protein [Paenibacillus sp. JJ-223]|uniref:SMI1/KNR4 family protein n=1 Tax=Paenibacillus sp. JJ-223 TaxID=2905647 RepID=UPI0033B32066
MEDIQNRIYLNMIMKHKEYSKEELPERIVPFGRDPFGNFLCFDYRSMQENPTIVFYDHESEVEDEKIIYVCDTFTQLLSELYSQ